MGQWGNEYPYTLLRMLRDKEMRCVGLAHGLLYVAHHAKRH
jgi:hypothetical protein